MESAVMRKGMPHIVLYVIGVAGRGRLGSIAILAKHNNIEVASVL